MSEFLSTGEMHTLTGMAHCGAVQRLKYGRYQVKKTKYPRLRSKSYKTVYGRILTYYVYDIRGTGDKDVRLDTDYPAALE